MGRVSTCQKNCNTIDLRTAQVNNMPIDVITTITQTVFKRGQEVDNPLISKSLVGIFSCNDNALWDSGIWHPVGFSALGGWAFSQWYHSMTDGALQIFHLWCVLCGGPSLPGWDWLFVCCRNKVFWIKDYIVTADALVPWHQGICCNNIM